MREPLWDWIDTFYAQAYWKHDEPRKRLARQHYEAWQLLETQPQQALAMLEKGSQLAHSLSEPWWQAFYEYWRTEAWVFYLRDLNQGLYYAVQNAVECRKPHFDNFPGKGRVYRVLIDAYMFQDPIGYAHKIHEIIQYMQDDIALDTDTVYLLQARRAQMDALFGQIEAAIDKATIYLNMSQHSAFRVMHAYEMLCFYAHLQEKYDLAEAYAVEVAENARRCQRKSGLLMSYLYRALLYRLRGDDKNAGSFYSRYLGVWQQMGIGRSTTSYDWLCAYHEAGGDTETAWALREEQVGALVDRGFYHDECWCRMRRLQLLGRMGRPQDDEFQQAQQAISRLQKPQVFADALARIRQGDTSDFSLFTVS